MPPPSINELLSRLAARRPVFHSEADFQHALAWEFQRADPEANIRLEKQVSTNETRVHLDLLVLGQSYELAIEVKYKTRLASISHSGELYSLRNQSAQDLGRHDFIKDIRRLEKYIEACPAAKGYAVLLTNDKSYWSTSRRSDTVDSQFRLHEKRVLTGSVTWGSAASEGTKHKREKAISLAGSYEISWSDFSSVGHGSGEQFRFVALEVPPVMANLSLQRTAFGSR
jgi:hypothetical protein